MKRPVKPKTEHVHEAMRKRKPKMVSVSQNIKGGTLSEIAQQILDFAAANGITESDVKFAGTGYYSTPHIKARRLESEEEFFKRVKRDLDHTYYQKRWRYEDYLNQQKRAKAAAAAAAGKCVTCGK